jgi:menaquinone-dependent protoporphyrinogen oxidase
MANRILIVYSTTHGHTAKIADRIARGARAAGARVETTEIEDAGDADPRDYDAVIVGASIHAGRHQPGLVRWATERAAALAERPSAFFSVSLTAADDDAEAREATDGYIESFVEETGWEPDRALPVAGCLQYREYDVFTRVLMKLLMRSGDHPTDTSRDYDYTDWDAVERFGREFAANTAAAA